MRVKLTAELNATDGFGMIKISLCFYTHHSLCGRLNVEQRNSLQRLSREMRFSNAHERFFFISSEIIDIPTHMKTLLISRKRLFHCTLETFQK